MSALMLNGIPIHIATKRIQKRKHHKYRINKKWAKRYGYIELNSMPDGQIVMYGGAFWMTQKTFKLLKQSYRNSINE